MKYLFMMFLLSGLAACDSYPEPITPDTLKAAIEEKEFDSDTPVIQLDDVEVLAFNNEGSDAEPEYKVRLKLHVSTIEGIAKTIYEVSDSNPANLPKQNVIAVLYPKGTKGEKEAVMTVKKNKDGSWYYGTYRAKISDSLKHYYDHNGTRTSWDGYKNALILDTPEELAFRKKADAAYAKAGKKFGFSGETIEEVVAEKKQEYGL